MALFSKPPAKKKKPLPPKAEAKVRPVAPGERLPSARDVLSEASAQRAGTPRGVQGPTNSQAKVIDIAKPKSGIEIEYSSTMCAAVENAALMFASAQARPARDALEQALEQDAEAKTSTLAWLCFFDLLRRANDKAAFDRAALQYVVQFERSAPGWEELGGPAPGASAAGSGGTIVLNGKLTAMSSLQLDSLKHIAQTGGTQVKLDLTAVSGFDDEGAKLLAAVLADVRRRRAPLEIINADKLRAALESAVNEEAREAGEGAWVLLLELLQWLGEQAAFDDRAVEYAVTFEMSPPSWEPASKGHVMPPRKAKTRGANDAELLPWTDAVTGSTPTQVKELLDFAQTRSNVVLDMTSVERVDFASAGALVNAIQRLGQQHKTLQIAGATPIVRALLLLVGVPGELFVRKPG